MSTTVAPGFSLWIDVTILLPEQSQVRRRIAHRYLRSNHIAQPASKAPPKNMTKQ